VIDAVTTALEGAAAVLLIVAAGWAVGDLAGVPAGLATSGACSGAASWLLQGAPVPSRRRGRA
jgi:hypothetical protein